MFKLSRPLLCQVDVTNVSRDPLVPISLAISILFLLASALLYRQNKKTHHRITTAYLLNILVCFTVRLARWLFDTDEDKVYNCIADVDVLEMNSPTNTPVSCQRMCKKLQCQCLFMSFS